jgi:hypothetical protein
MVSTVSFKRRLIFTLAYGLAFLAIGSYRSRADTIPSGTIDLSQPANLKMVFDGGLRPYRLQGLESSTCNIMRTNITVIFPNASSFAFEVQGGSFSVLNGNDLSGMDLFGVYTTVPDAVTLTKTICQAGGMSSKGLDDTIAHLGTMPGSSPGWGNRFRRANLDFQVTFQPMYYFDHVGAQVCLFVHFGNYSHGMKFLTKPIQPPPGYENVSMDPPPFEPSNPSVPAMSLEEAQAKVKRKYEELTHKQIEPPPAQSGIPESTPKLIPSPSSYGTSSTPTASSFPIIPVTIGLIALLIGIAAYLFRSRK